MEISMALFCHPLYRDKAAEEGAGAEEDTFLLFAVRKQPEPRRPTLRQGEF